MEITCHLDDGFVFVLLSCFTAIKVNCQGSCGISSKLNDSSWAVEEQYFNSTLSMADKGSSIQIILHFILFHSGKETKAPPHYHVPLKLPVNLLLPLTQKKHQFKSAAVRIRAGLGDFCCRPAY